MFKVAVFFLFSSVVYCTNVYRQLEQDIDNPFLRYRYIDENREMSFREWQRRRERRNQRERQRAEWLSQWFEGDYEESEQERYERYREQQRWRVREEEEYEPNYEVSPCWASYDSEIYPSWETIVMSLFF